MKKLLAWVWIFIVAACLYSGFSLLVNIERDVTFLEGLGATTAFLTAVILITLSSVGLIALTAKCIKVLKDG